MLFKERIWLRKTRFFMYMSFDRKRSHGCVRSCAFLIANVQSRGSFFDAKDEFSVWNILKQATFSDQNFKRFSCFWYFRLGSNTKIEDHDPQKCTKGIGPPFLLKGERVHKKSWLNIHHNTLYTKRLYIQCFLSMAVQKPVTLALC